MTGPSSLSARFDAWGRLVYARRWLVLAICAVLVALGGAAATQAPAVLYGATVELPGSESGRVAEALRTDFANPFAEIVVVAAESQAVTLADPRFQAWLRAVDAALAASPDVQAVRSLADGPDPRLGAPGDRRTAVLVGLVAANVQEAEKATPRLRAAVQAAGEAMKAQDPGFVWATTGRGALSHDLASYGGRDSQAAEARVLPLTCVILLLAFGALVAAGIPLAMGLAATTVGVGLIAGVGHFTPLSSLVMNIGTMVGLAVGIDYSLLMLARFREALGRGQSTEDALAETMRTAGVAVLCSGLTVIIGMAGLALTPALDTRSIGLGGAIVIGAGVLLALTLLPAVLATLGPRVDAPRGLSRWLRPVDAPKLWRGWAAFVMRHPVKLAALGAVLLGAMCAPLAWLNTHYEGSKQIPAHELEFHTGFDILERMGRKNAATPIQIVVRCADDCPIFEPARLKGLLEISARLHADPRVLEVVSPVDLKPGLDYMKLYKHWPAVLGLAKDRYAPIVSQDRRAVAFYVVPASALSFERMMDLVRDLRAERAPEGLTVAIGGQGAFYADLHAGVRDAFPGMVAFVVGATFVVLALAYRSILVPLKATILNVLSVGAGCGALVVLFQLGIGKELIGLEHATEGVPLTLLAMVFCVVFGLSMDYEVFLISRIKELYDETGDNAAATEGGLASTGGLITAAALIMVTVFGGFAWAKLTVVKMMGVGLGVAVLVDATIVRVLLAPALMRLAGAWNWAPGGRRVRELSSVVPAASEPAPTPTHTPRT